jgi:molecular chaperone DnaK
MAIVGIDLGTTFSAIAVLDDIGNPEVVASIDNDRITPSVVYISAENKIYVGDKAKNAGRADKKGVIKEVKRKMPQTDTVYDITQGKWMNGQSDNKTKFSPSDISSAILRKLKTFTEDVNEVIITIPANFADEARIATRRAAEAAGLKVIELINEPTAAVLHYANLPNVNLSGKVLVFDLGGGTFDITVANVSGKKIDVLCSGGDPNLGGTDFDREIFKLLNEKYKSDKGSELELNDVFMDLCEKIKRTLTAKEISSNVIDGPDGPLKIEITRDEFVKSIETYIAKIEMMLQSLMDSDEVGGSSSISEILLVGGSTRSPFVNKIIENIMGKPALKGVNVDEAVALGAALFAGLESKSKLNTAQKKSIEQLEVTDVSNYNLGTRALQLNPVTNQDEAMNSIIIRRNTKLPCKETQTYYTTHDDQESVKLVVTRCSEAETDLDFVDTLWSGRLELPGGRAAGQAIDVTFEYDKSNYLSASFVDVASGKKEDIDIFVGGGKASSERDNKESKSSDDKDPFIDFEIDD